MSTPNFFPIALLGSNILNNAYIAWQRQCGKTGNIGFLGLAADYVDFCIDQDTRDFIDRTGAGTHHLASKCGHPLHPSAEDHEYCPVCIVDVYLIFGRRVASAWDRFGGPWQSSANPRFAQQCRLLRRVWICFRLELAQLTSSLEEEVDAESEWEAKHPDYGVDTARLRTTANAVICATTMVKYPVVDDSILCSRDSSGSQTRPTSQRRRKTVHFMSVAIVFEKDSSIEASGGIPNHRKDPLLLPQVHDGPSRPLEKWTRRETDYEPGRYASKSPEGWADTSFMKDQVYSLGQLKVYVFPDPSFDKSWLDTAESEGFASEHRFWPDICSSINAGMSDETISWNMVAQVHCVVVSTRDDIFQHLRLLAMDDDLSNERTPVGATKWTSVSEILMQAPETVLACD
ncbi:hypothetical protein B5807_00372 [Epicoccum nigrum]|uniref:Uncharacterized protein n=1 Tax=Epicoccum nigrum TaxID=105696 RepID=A0A1Y2MDK1_EPING|nr:hypothetical protein B5807_00372 [Epicoccum nigrum]